MWKLERDNLTIPGTTDNAGNIVNAVALAGLGPQIGCFPNIINLASQKNYFSESNFSPPSKDQEGGILPL